jgi:protein TonB
MSYELVRRKMGGEGIPSVMRNPDNRETSAADYPGPTRDVYVEYDRRINRGKAARAVRVRASMPLLPTIAAALVDRFGVPDAGADKILDDLNDGIAVWVDESCGLVLTAYHPRESWWKTEGRTTLQLETLDLARRGDSPASSSLSEILARKRGTPAESSVATSLPADTTIPPQGMTFLANSFQPNNPPIDQPVVAVVAPLPRQPEPEVSAPAPPPVPAAARTIETWHPKVSASITVPAPRAVATPAPGVPVEVAPDTPPDKLAERITYIPPVYPRTARWLGVPGHVTLAIVVRTDGTITKTPRVLAENPPGKGFAEAAVEAVRQWTFSPAIRKGNPVKSTLTVDIEFESQKY